MRTFKNALNRLFPGLTEDPHQQAKLGLRAGGIGMRAVTNVARPAALASQITASPKVRELDDNMARAGLIQAGDTHDVFLEDMRMTQEAFEFKLNPAVAPQLQEMVDRGNRSAERQWRALMQGKAAEADEEETPRAQWLAVHEDDVMAPAGGGWRQ